jgi:hypothetical protein
VRATLPCRTEVQMLWFLVAGFTAVFFAHTAPFPFLLERFAPSRFAQNMTGAPDRALYAAKSADANE